MAKIVTVALVVIMLVVGFGSRLSFRSIPYAANIDNHRYSVGKHTENRSHQSRHRPNMATLPTTRSTSPTKS